MIGEVDQDDRALLEVTVRCDPDEAAAAVTVWIDTAFDGHLVFSRELIEELDFEPLAETEAILAHGTKVVLQAFLCYLDWFGELIPLQVIANEGRFPLLGTGLLNQRDLRINYATGELTLS